jgi:hypothetical protein
MADMTEDYCPECKFGCGAHRIGCSLMPDDMQQAFIQMAEKMMAETPEDQLVRYLFYVLEDAHVTMDDQTKTKVTEDWLKIIKLWQSK